MCAIKCFLTALTALYRKIRNSIPCNVKISNTYTTTVAWPHVQAIRYCKVPLSKSLRVSEGGSVMKEGSLSWLTVLVQSRCSQCSGVSDGQCKSRPTHVHVTISEEVMSSGQLALICATPLCEKCWSRGGAKTQVWLHCPCFFLKLWVRGADTQ